METFSFSYILSFICDLKNQKLFFNLIYHSLLIDMFINSCSFVFSVLLTVPSWFSEKNPVFDLQLHQDKYASCIKLIEYI